MRHTLAALGFALLFVTCRHQEMPTPMPPNLPQILENLNPEDRRAKAALGDSLKTETYAIAQELTKYWRRNPAPKGDKALFLLQQLGSAAYDPLMAGIDTVSPEDRLFVLEDLVEKHLQMRHDLAAKLDAQLDDKRVLDTAPPSPDMEQPPPPSRICDQAYLLLRRLTHVTENDFDGSAEAWQFRRLEEKQKDEAIAKARQSREWQTFLGKED
jgi:hypothetical protein